MMRIISGVRRGKKLFSLPGDNTRPTLERVKQALFNAIQFEIKDRKVLDLFAGSGQLGLEALSRGASFCHFNDLSEDALSVVRKNVEACDFAQMSKLTCKTHTECVKMIENAGGAFSLVFLDPPYNNGLTDDALSLLPPVLEKGALVVCETDAAETPRHPAYTLYREYKYSEIKITILVFGEDK